MVVARGARSCASGTHATTYVRRQTPRLYVSISGHAMALRSILFICFAVPISAFTSVAPNKQLSMRQLRVQPLRMQANDMPARMQMLVQELKTLGAQKSQVEEAFASALATVYAEPSAPAASVSHSSPLCAASSDASVNCM